MARFLSQFVASTLGIAALMPLASGQSSATPAAAGAPAASSPVLAPTQAEKAPPPAQAAPKRQRVISSEVAAALAAATPKYTPPPPKPEPQPEREPIDLRDIDKPKNTIIRLPAVVVQEAKPPVFSERAIHTEKGLTDIAMRRYISDVDRAMNRWTLPLFGTSAEARAMAMYAEDERLRNMAELHDAAIDASRTDPAAGDYIRREATRTYLRSSDFGWSSGDPK
jgi:hypothetical protein